MTGSVYVHFSGELFSYFASPSFRVSAHVSLLFRLFFSPRFSGVGGKGRKTDGNNRDENDSSYHITERFKGWKHFSSSIVAVML